MRCARCSTRRRGVQGPNCHQNRSWVANSAWGVPPCGRPSGYWGISVWSKHAAALGPMSWIAGCPKEGSISRILRLGFGNCMSSGGRLKCRRRVSRPRGVRRNNCSNIRAAWDRCQTAVQNNSADEFARLDFRFHYSIIQASGNAFYIEAYRALETSFASYVSLILALGPLQSMLHFHDGLISAIARRDPDAAAVAVGENFLETDVRVRLLTNNAGEFEDGD